MITPVSGFSLARFSLAPFFTGMGHEPQIGFVSTIIAGYRKMRRGNAKIDDVQGLGLDPLSGAGENDKIEQNSRGIHGFPENVAG